MKLIKEDIKKNLYNEFYIDPEEEEMFILFRENRKEWEKRMKQHKSKKK